MTKETIKISFNFIYSPSGTVYKKALTMSDKIKQEFILALTATIKTEKNHLSKMYLSARPECSESVIFLNLTQSSFLIKWLSNNKKVIINQKRASYQANTCLIINN